MRYYVRLYSFTLISEGGWCESDSMLFVACLSVGQMFECQWKDNTLGPETVFTIICIPDHLQSWSSVHLFVMVICLLLLFEFAVVCGAFDGVSLWTCVCHQKKPFCQVFLSSSALCGPVVCQPSDFSSANVCVLHLCQQSCSNGATCVLLLSTASESEMCVTPSWSPGFTYLPKACG